MKNIRYMLMMLTAALITFSSCSKDNDPYFSAGEDDFPKILNSDLLDFDGMGGGKLFSLPGITRDQPFKYEAIVTPTEYTNVTWFFNGEQVTDGVIGEHGTKIETYLTADIYQVDIVATTTKGKKTSRSCKLIVTALPDDPNLAVDPANRYLQLGTEKKMKGKNLEGATAVIINGIVIEAREEGGHLCFTVPEDLPEGDGKLILVKGNEKFGCGEVKISAEEYKEGSEKVLWEATPFDVTWGTPFDALKESFKASIEAGEIAAGAVLTVYVEGEGQGCIATAWWTNVATGGSGDTGRGDTVIDAETEKLVCTLTDEGLERITSQDGLLIVGNGFKVKKVTITVAEKVLWSGSFDVTWGTAFDALKDSFKESILAGDITAGMTLYADVKGEGQGCIATAWWTNVATGGSGDTGRGDTVIDAETTQLVCPLTEEGLARITEQDGLLIVGNGYTVTKVYLK